VKRAVGANEDLPVGDGRRAEHVLADVVLARISNVAPAFATLVRPSSFVT
jgi:hypothetical protein